MKVHWTQTASSHLLDHYGYISKDSVIYAQRMVDKLTQRSIQLADQPYSGRVVPEYRCDDIREVIEGSYRIIYRILQDKIDVLGVIRVERILPEDFSLL